jgi:signal transduction histidine kinase
MLFRSRPAFDALSTRQFIWYLLAAGLAVSLAVMLMLRAQVRARAQAEENEAWIRFAWEATAYAASSLDPLAMAESLARYCLPTLGEWCAMDVLDDDGKPSRVMLTPVDPAREELAAALRRYPLDGRAGPLVGQVLAEKQGLRFELNDQMLAAVAQDAAHLELMKRANMRGLMVVPLICRGRTLGWLSLLRAHPYSERDLAVLEDVGRRVAMALDNARLYDQAQDAVRTRDAFLAIAAHELKAPLTTLQLQAQGLQRMIGRDAPLDQMQLLQRTTIIDRQSKRLANLIDDMMDVSRVAAGRLTFNVQDVDLVQLVREVVERFEDESLQVGSSLELDLPESAVGRWDRVRLDQVLTNLLSNALKYGEQQPVAIRVETSPGLVRVCVQDRGIGIAAENQGRIFERFERFVSGQHYVGFGLGLWITRQIVEAQGGHVLVESEPGQGSRFVIELPTGH